MAGPASALRASAAPLRSGLPALREPALVRWLLILVTFAFLATVLFLPLLAVFGQAFAKGIPAYLRSLSDPDTRAAIGLTLFTAAVAVPVNAVFGIAAAWSIAKFEFRGKSLLITLIDLPFAVSPVISGLVFILLFGLQGWLGPWLRAHDIQIIF